MSRTRLTAAAVVLALLPVAPHLPALATLILLAATLAALNGFEYAKVRRATTTGEHRDSTVDVSARATGEDGQPHATFDTDGA